MRKSIIYILFSICFQHLKGYPMTFKTNGCYLISYKSGIWSILHFSISLNQDTLIIPRSKKFTLIVYKVYIFVVCRKRTLPNIINLISSRKWFIFFVPGPVLLHDRWSRFMWHGTQLIHGTVWGGNFVTDNLYKNNIPVPSVMLSGSMTGSSGCYF